MEEHLLDPERFWLPVPPPSVSAADPSFSLKDTGLLCGMRRYWRGPTWINAAWLVWLGLVRLGYDEPAEELAERLGATVAAQRAARVLPPVHRRGDGRDRLRLVDAWCWSCSTPTRDAGRSYLDAVGGAAVAAAASLVRPGRRALTSGAWIPNARWT